MDLIRKFKQFSFHFLQITSHFFKPNHRVLQIMSEFSCELLRHLLKWLPQWPKLFCSFRTKPVGGDAGHRPGRCGGLSPASRLPAAQRPALAHLLLRGHAQWEPAQPLLPRRGRHRLHGPWRPQDDAELLVQAVRGVGDPAAGHAPRRPRHPAAGLPLCLHPGDFFFWRFSMESEFASTLVRFLIYNQYFCYLRGNLRGKNKLEHLEKMFNYANKFWGFPRY